MNKFDDISLQGKLAINFLISGGVLIAAIVFCLLQINSVGRDTEEISTNWLPSVQQAGEISQLRLRYRVRSLEFMLAASDEERVKIGESLSSLDKLLGEALKKYEPLISSEEEKKIFQELGNAVAAYRAAVLEAIEHARAGRVDEAQKLRRGLWVKAADSVRDQTDALLKINRTGSEGAASRVAKDVRTALSGGLVALLLGVGLAIAASFLISRNLVRRLSASVHAAQQIAAGDLTGKMPESTADEVGRLVSAMAEMQQSLRRALMETRANANSIFEHSGHLNDAVHQMEQSAAVQSAAASAIAANVEEVTVSINHVSDNTRDAARLAHDSDQQAKSGYEELERLIVRIGDVAGVVRGAAEQIKHLEDESGKISNIVAVIKDIADQTNLLALNAAIEAARAGEQGRGFAVVADEVRKLSERTAVSTGEISQMVAAIQHSTRDVVAEVGRGVALVDEGVDSARMSGEAIAKLREMAQEVARIVASVNDTLREQSAASTDVAQKIESVAAQAEESSGIAQKTSQAAASMAETATGMQNLVARFRI